MERIRVAVSGFTLLREVLMVGSQSPSFFFASGGEPAEEEILGGVHRKPGIHRIWGSCHGQFLDAPCTMGVEFTGRPYCLSESNR